MENNRVILGVMSSGQRVDVKKLANFCEKQQELILKTGFPGHKVLFPPTVHELYAHLPSMIAENKGYGLKQFSEENLESAHKSLRHIREKLARKTSKRDNLRDSLRRINLPSDPILSSYNSRCMYSCSLCQEKGHTKVTCDLAVSKDDIDTKVQEFFIADTDMDLDLDEEEVDTEKEGNDENEESDKSDFDDEQEEAVYDRQAQDIDPDDILVNLFDSQEDQFEAGCYRTSYYDDLVDEAEISDYEDLFG